MNARRGIALSLVAQACGWAIAFETPVPSEPVPKYPDTAEGLQKWTEDMLAADKSSDKDKLSSAARAAILPDAESWFKKMFGDEAGAKLSAEYAKMAGDPADFEKTLLGLIHARNEKGQTEVRIMRIEKADDKNATGAQKKALEAMKTPTPLYTIRFVEPGKDVGFTLWSFVYVDGGFRLAGKMRALAE